jgi:hypothetical protein
MVHNDSILCFGDGAYGHWYGPATYLHKIAAYYRDPLAQGTAALYRSAQASTRLSSLYSLLWYADDVPATPANELPLARHFTDKDIVFMRSDWQGDETIVGFKCGPHAGHHALQHYPQCIGGGHMAPDAGTVLLYAYGERMISDGGYAQKYTAFRNTVLVNGKGQTGETDGTTDWFECSDLRREKRGPFILRADLSAELDYLIGNVAPAYGPEAGLTRYLRHLVYLRNRDVPGVIGRIGTVLGAAKINIANFSLGRAEQAARAAGASASRAIGGGTGVEAVCVVDVDTPVPETVLHELRAIPAITIAKAIRLG